MQRFLKYIEQHTRIPDLICAIILATAPILQHFVGLIDSASSTLLAITVPYLALRLLPRLRMLCLDKLAPVFTLMLFFLYKMADHGTSMVEVAQVLLVIGFLTVAVLECIDLELLTKAACVIAALAGATILLQYFCYYVCDFHLQLVPVPLMLPEASDWIPGVQTGLIGITGKVGSLYRPAAFFMEPSHLFLYSFPALFIQLFYEQGNGKKKYVIAGLITIGMVLSTSGMGIAVAVAAWVIFFAFRNEKNNDFKLKNVLRKRNLIFLGVLMAVVVLAILFIPFVRASVVRIFSSTSGSSAISARIDRALNTLKKMTFGQWILGVSDSTANLQFNMPGFMATIYKYGIIGVILSYEYYVKSFLKLDLSYFQISGVILVVSFFSAQTHGTFFMLFYVLLLMRGHHVNTGEWTEELKSILHVIPKRKKSEIKNDEN